MYPGELVPLRVVRPVFEVADSAKSTFEQCSRKKLFCDGLTPCGSCSGRDKSHACSHNARNGNDARILDTAPDIPAISSVSDRVPPQATTHYPSSVAFLLSEDYEHIFSKFNFPEPTSPDESANRRAASWRDAYSSAAQTPSRGLDEDFMNSVLDFDFFPLGSRGPSTRCASAEPQSVDASEDATQFRCTPGDTERLLVSVMKAPTIMLLHDHVRIEVHQRLRDLCHPTCVARFIGYYFKIWHLNCRIVHRPSFGFETCDESLILAVMFMGVMYSPDATERLAASYVIEHVESYIFSCLSSPSPTKGHCQDESDGASGDEREFQIVQAAFTMVITLFWTGVGVQKRRAATELFDIVVEVREVCVYFEVWQHLMTRHIPESALARSHDFCAIF